MSYYNTHSRKSSRSIPVSVIVTLVVIVAIIVGLCLIWPNIPHAAYAFIRTSWLTLLVPLALIITAIIYSYIKDILSIAVLGAIVGLCLAGTLFGIQEYVAMNALSQNNEISKKSPNALSFAPRQPYDVAVSTSTRTLGDTQGTSTGYVKALPALGESGLYTTSVIRQGFLQGYESTQVLNPPVYGASDNSSASFCAWDEDKAPLRLGGALPVNSLEGAVMRNTPVNTRMHTEDAFVTCQKTAKPGDTRPGDTPVIYMPLVEYGPGLFPYTQPAGIAVYDGLEGKLVILDSLDAPELPVYPSSVATDQRKSTVASGNIYEYYFGKVGWLDTGKDGDDPNGINRAEFGMFSEDTQSHQYVTPLNPQGASRSIVGIGNIDAGQVSRGKLSTYRVNLYGKDGIRQANSTVADVITGDVLQGYQAQGLTVFEVVPERNGNWVATIGKAQSVLYKATIAPDESVILLDKNGNRVGTALTKEGDVESVDVEEVVTPSGDYAQLTENELRTIIDAALDELSSRIAE